MTDETVIKMAFTTSIVSLLWKIIISVTSDAFDKILNKILKIRAPTYSHFSDFLTVIIDLESFNLVLTKLYLSEIIYSIQGKTYDRQSAQSKIQCTVYCCKK